ncbi:two-component system regulatory protein YycI [uncultured Granulicatella sp.]|uniref:two-component system regulatory protein YycI n=1 Tax=uncultured Granulicatella sp. TaxID=316089 RepID=UPI0028D67B33|nr:two-component system regulatory protein YycI [uncultured Granulicatella sp.]
MDFRRSTLVLIISFLFLDIFLLGIFWQMKNEVKTPLNTSINVMEQMRTDGITVTGVNTTVESLPIIQITPTSIESQVNTLPSQVATYDKGVISSQLLAPIQLTLDANANATIENFAELTTYVESGSIIHGNQYTWFNYNPTTRKVIYAQRANQIPVMDGSSQIIFTLNANNQVISYEQTFAGNAEVLGTNRALITSQKAMEVLYLAGRIPTRSTVSVVRLSYYKSLSLKDLSIYSPAWYVEFKQADGQTLVRRVDAIRGTVLTNEATETVNTTTP